MTTPAGPTAPTAESPTTDPSFGPPNYWAVASLLCGIVGCLLVTPVVAVVAGSVGLVRARRTGVGRGMSRVGVSLGAFWLVVYAIGLAGGVWTQRHGAMRIAEWHRGETVELINRLPGGHLDRYAAVYRIGDGRAKELAGVVAPLGDCRDVRVTRAGFTNRDGVFGVEFDGVAVFERGQWPLRARLFFNGSGWGFSELDWQ